MKRILALALPLSLTACATFSQMENGLNYSVGKDLSYLVNKIGYPTGERTVSGMRLVEWGRSADQMIVMPTTSTTTGQVRTPGAYANYYGTTTTNTFIPVNYNCTISVQVSQSNTILGYQYNGNLGGCTPYIRALKIKKSR